MSTAPGGSVVVRRSLGRRLRTMRQDARKSAADVVEAGICSRAKLNRIENGTGTVRMTDVRALCWLYGADTVTTDALSDLALNASGPGWWEDYGDVMPPWFAMFVELESAATRALVYDPTLVYGLLQTPAYARAIHEADPVHTPETIARNVSLRAERQRAVFGRTPPLQVSVVMEPGAVAREVGGPDVAAEQRAKLCEAASEPHADVRVLPHTGGAHAAMQGAFTILEFDAEDDPDVVYLETRAGARYIEKGAVVQDYHNLFRLIHAKSVPIGEHVT